MKPKTLFIDIDGTLIHHHGHLFAQLSETPKALPGVIDKLIEWDRKGYIIVLTTGRRESHREATVRQLQELGIFYDQLVMGIGGGARVLINDTKPDHPDLNTATGICVIRNTGLESVEV